MSTDRLTAEQVREAIFNGSGYASFDGVKYYADGIDMQAIADELNATLDTQADDYKQAAKYWQRMYEEAFAERTCKVAACYDTADVDSCGSNAEWYFAFTCGDELYWDEPEPPNYCPNCGAKVVGE